MSREPSTGVLCMAYGSPATEADIAAYYTHIRGGRPPSQEALEELTERYRAIKASPLTEITRAQAAALSLRTGLPTFVGMKHAAPFIADGAAEARRAGIERLVGLPLAPHYARMSLGAYESALRGAWDGDLLFIAGFFDHPAFVAAVQGLLREALAHAQPERLFFTAHSLPARILAEGDPYRDQLLESCRLVASGMDLLESVERSGAREVLVCPIGFVADHLEILYDLDIEAQEFGAEKGIRIRRTRSFNARPEFVDALAQVVRNFLIQSADGPRRSRTDDLRPASRG